MEKIYIEGLQLSFDKLFDSLKKAFYNTTSKWTKYSNEKASFIEIILILLRMLIIFSVFTGIGISSAIKKYFPEYQFIENYSFFTFTLIVVLYLISIPIWKIINKVDKKIDYEKSLRNLNNSQIPFCLLHSTIQHLENYIESNIKVDLITAQQNFRWYLQRSDIKRGIKTRLPSKGTPTGDAFPSYNIVKQIELIYPWFSVDKETQEILDSFETTERKILERIIQGVELNSIIHPLKLLEVYEYSRLKTIDSIDKHWGSLENFQKICLLNYAEEISKISILDNKDNIPVLKKNMFKIIMIKVFSWLNSENRFVCFLSWYLFVQIVCLVGFYFFVKNYNLNVDTTLVVGLVTVPLLGAITMAAISKNNTDNKPQQY